jgi:hypothetical protein
MLVSFEVKFMQETIVNVTSLAIDEELKNLLDRYPYQRYQAEFSNPEKRQVLIDSILKKMPNRCVEIPVNRLDEIPELLTCVSTQKRLAIESLLEQGIQALAKNDSGLMERILTHNRSSSR